MLFLNNIFPQWTLPEVFNSNFTYEEQIGYLTSAFNKLSDYVKEMVENLTEKLPEEIASEVDKKLGNVYAQLNNIEISLASAKSDIRNIQKDVSLVYETVEKLTNEINEKLEVLENTLKQDISDLYDWIDSVEGSLQTDIKDAVRKETIQRIIEDNNIWSALDDLKQSLYPPIFNIFRQNNTSIQTVLNDFYRFGRYGSVTAKTLMLSGITAGELDALGLSAYEFDWFLRDVLSVYSQTKNPTISEKIIMSPVDGQNHGLSYTLNEIYNMVNQNSKIAESVKDRNANDEGSEMTVKEYSTSRESKADNFDDNKYYNDYVLVWHSDVDEQTDGYIIPVTADEVRIIHSGGTGAEYVTDVQVSEGDVISIIGSENVDGTGVYIYQRNIEYGQYEESEMVMMNGFTLKDCYGYTPMGVSEVYNNKCVIKKIYAKTNNYYQAQRAESEA